MFCLTLMRYNSMRSHAWNTHRTLLHLFPPSFSHKIHQPIYFIRMFIYGIVIRNSRGIANVVISSHVCHERKNYAHLILPFPVNHQLNH